MIRMTPFDIPHHRLYNHHLSQTTLGTPAEAVDWLVAVQAQDFAGAKWALGRRLNGAVEDEMEQAFTGGVILRTHLLRPTWHFVTPADIRWLLALTAPRVHTANAHMYRRLELDETIFTRSEATMVKALQGGNQMTRDELRIVLEQAGITTEGVLRMAYLMMHAELEGVVCSGPRHGKQFTYMLLDERVPPSRTMEPEEALVELTRRYFMSRGPATVQDFAKWSGLTLTECRHGLEAVETRLEQEGMNGQTYYLPASAPAGVASPKAYLLSIYDEYISGYKDHSPIGGATYGAQLAALGNALSYILLVDGQIAGSCGARSRNAKWWSK